MPAAKNASPPSRPDRGAAGRPPATAPTAHAASGPAARVSRGLLALLLLAAVLPYLNAFGHQFVRDDEVIVRDNPALRSLPALLAGLTDNYWGDAQPDCGLWRPVVLLSWAANFAVGGLDTTLYTAVDIALHAGVCLVLLRLALALGAGRAAALAAALLFAVHPVHTEAVTGFVGRADTLATLLALLALLAHARHGTRAGAGDRPGAAGDDSRSRASWPWLAALWLALALLTKENTIALLLVIPALDWLVPAGARSQRWRAYALYATVAALYLLARWAVLGTLARDPSTILPRFNPVVAAVVTPLGDVRGASPLQARLTPFAVATHAAALLLWPSRLSADASFNALPLADSAADPRVLGGLLLTSATLLGVLLLTRRAPVAAFGLSFGALTYMVTSNMLFPIGTLFAERLLYLPSAGFLLAAGVGCGALWQRVQRLPEAAAPRLPRSTTCRLLLALFGSVLLLGAARTWQRNPVWRDADSITADMVATAPDSFLAQQSRGMFLAQRAEELLRSGRAGQAAPVLAEAAAFLEHSLAICPEHEPANRSLIAIGWARNDLAGTLPLYEREARLRPDDPVVHGGWASALVSLQRAPEALAHLDTALAMDPGHVDALVARGLLRRDAFHDPAGAAADLRRALALAPDHADRAALLPEIERLQRLAGGP